MVEFCFETVNWSPYLGYEKPDVREMIRVAADNGFAWITLDLSSIGYFTAHEGTLADLKAELAARKVKLLAIQALSISDDVAEVEALTRSAVEICAALGARYLQVGATAPMSDRLVEATRRAEQICREAGVGFAFEFLPFLPVATIAQTQALLKAAGIHGRTVVLDTWHFFHGPDDWADLDRLSESEIAFIQFNDHGVLESDDLFEETVQKRVLPGEGKFDLKQFVSRVRGLGFDGVVGLEIISRATRAQPMEDVARRTIAASRPFWLEG